MLNIFFLLFGFLNVIHSTETKELNHEITNDYILVNEGATKYNINNEFYKFSTGLNSDYILATTTSIKECKDICIQNLSTRHPDGTLGCNFITYMSGYSPKTCSTFSICNQTNPG